MVFVHSRGDTFKTAEALAQMAIDLNHMSHFDMRQSLSRAGVIRHVMLDFREHVYIEVAQACTSTLTTTKGRREPPTRLSGCKI